MNISWHLLFEQLQRNPELLKEDLEGELAALSSQSEMSPISAEKNTEAIEKLQQRLGNSGFQKLWAQRNALMASATVNDKTAQQDGKTNSTASSEENILLDAADKKTVPEEQLKTRPSENMKQTAMDRKTSKEPDPVIRLGTILQQFITQLPGPSLHIWKTLSDLFDPLSPMKQANVISALVKRVQTLPQTEQQLFVKMAQNLPGGLAQTALIAALIAKLLSLMSKAPEVELPETPEE